MTATAWLRLAAILLWLFLPLILAVVALVRWRQAHKRGVLLRDPVTVPIAVAVLINLIFFLVLLTKAELGPYGTIFRTSELTHALLFFSCVGMLASLVSSFCRWHLSFSNFLLVTLWVGIAYAPAHWLRTWNYATVTINGHPSPASAFIAEPWNNEAEAIVLVRVPAASDYFLSFGEEKVRVAGNHEYIRLPGGVWCLPSLRDMRFVESLPPTQMNEFRIASPQGSIVSVQF